MQKEWHTATKPLIFSPATYFFGPRVLVGPGSSETLQTLNFNIKKKSFHDNSALFLH
jgi:hypothetical protein